MTPEQRKEKHDELHDTINNVESLYNELVRVMSHPLWTVREKAGLLRASFADVCDYEGHNVGRYAKYTQIVLDETESIPVIDYEEWRAKYRPRKARKLLCPKCMGDYAKGDTHCMHCGFYLVGPEPRCSCGLPVALCDGVFGH